jgi:hypothetical protein
VAEAEVRLVLDVERLTLEPGMVLLVRYPTPVDAKEAEFYMGALQAIQDAVRRSATAARIPPVQVLGCPNDKGLTFHALIPPPPQAASDG